jgi:microcystin-dependent protein
MSTPYVGEIRMFGGNFAPAGWMLCEGQALPISEYDTLFALIGTTYGGDGQSTFNLPDLRGRLPLHMGTSSQGTSYAIGEAGGVERVTLTVQQIPAHNHQLMAAAVTGNQVSPAGSVPASSYNVTPYINDQPAGSMHASAISPVGGNQPHENMQPYLCINFIISLFGIFPSQT